MITEERVINKLDIPDLLIVMTFLGYDLFKTTDFSYTFVKPFCNKSDQMLLLFIQVDTSNTFFTAPVISWVDLPNNKVSNLDFVKFIYRSTVQVNKDTEDLIRLLNSKEFEL